MTAVSAPYGHLPPGMTVIPSSQLDLRSDAEIEDSIRKVQPVRTGNEKNIWAFWDKGYDQMADYLKRNVIAWYRRLAPFGWHIYVLDLVEGSPLHVKHFIDVNDPNTVPRAFTEGTLDGEFAPQHTSDLVRFPLILKYGGAWMDVGVLQFGDLNRLWDETIGHPQSPYDFVGFAAGDQGPNCAKIANYFFMCGRNHGLIQQAHRILLAIWAENNGRTNVNGACKSPFVKDVALIGVSDEYNAEDKESAMNADRQQINDYLLQIQALGAAQALIRPEDNWNGPEHLHKNSFIMSMLHNSNLPNQLTMWNGQKLWDLWSSPVTEAGTETAMQKEAREITEVTASKCFCFKMMHGFIAKYVFKGDTVAMLWKKHPGSDNVPGTWAHWLRYASVYWQHDELPQPLAIPAGWTPLIKQRS